MIKVNEILQLSLFKKFKLICGEDYLNNSVAGAVILEYESIKNNYTGFNNGDFVLASYFFAYANSDIVNGALGTIIKRHVSGIAIKINSDQHIPDELINLATENHVPLFTFTNEYMEDLIINISESLKTKAQYIVLEEKLHSLINGNPDSHTNKQTALEINPDFLPYLVTANITPIDKADNISIHSYFKRLMYRQYRTTEKCSYSFVKYKYGIVLICSFEIDSLPKNGEHYNYVSSILKEVDFNPNDFYIGICNNAVLLKNFNTSLNRAIDANIICQYTKSAYTTYSSMGIHKYMISMVNNRILYRYIESHINTLKEYDSSYASNLLDTLIVYIKNNGDIPKTSNAIFQHANTVRYRIKKACMVLGLSPEHPYEEIYIIISCYLLNKFMNMDED